RGFPLSLSHLSHGIAISSLSLFALGPVLVQIGILPPRLGFYAFLASAPLGLAAVGLGAFFALKGGGMAGWRLVAVGLLPLAVIIAAASKGRDMPMINDISTDLT